jgi:choline dehydrogenase-like flavoprotein
MASQPVYDVIVVGSGAAGGIAAYVLATKPHLLRQEAFAD